MENETYFLMHKDIKVASMQIDDNGNISKLRKKNDTSDHLPIGGQMNDVKFHEWWIDRAIPKTRHGAKNALEKLGYQSTSSALVNNLALSLNDCYWIRPRGENLKWDEVNLFKNDFVDNFGELTFDNNYKIDIRSKTRFDSATSQGELQKKWCIDKDRKKIMIKGNYGDSCQQSLNELFATALHEKQNYDNFTSYYPINIKSDSGRDTIGCYSFNFCNENVESISAWEVLQTAKIKQNESLFYPFKKACISLGISEDEFYHFMDYEIITDFLITNTDRHMNNIAILRNPDTLKVIGMAPIYDSGNSMFYKDSIDELRRKNLKEIKTSSFIVKEIRLLSYVKDRKAVDLSNTDVDFNEIYSLDIKERHNRIEILEKLYNSKRAMLDAFQNGKDIWKYKVL